VNQNIFNGRVQILRYHVKNIIVTVTAMTAVESHPITQSGRGTVNAPITFGRMVMIIMTTSTLGR
jgi:hypothetical protein